MLSGAQFVRDMIEGHPQTCVRRQLLEPPIEFKGFFEWELRLLKHSV